jgi:hypothetical protein
MATRQRAGRSEGQRSWTRPTKSSRPDQPERRLAETARLRKPQALSGLDHL